MNFSTTKIQFVVIGEHTLGYHLPSSNSIGILRASKLRGSPYGENPIAIPTEGMRLAKEADFADYKVDCEGYKKDDMYEILT